MSKLKVKLSFVQHAIGALRSLTIMLFISFLLGELVFQILKPNIPYQYAPQKIIQNLELESFHKTKSYSISFCNNLVQIKIHNN